MKQKLIELKVKIDKSTITAGDFNTPFLVIDRTSGQKTVNNIKDLNNTKNLT